MGVWVVEVMAQVVMMVGGLGVYTNSMFLFVTAVVSPALYVLGIPDIREPLIETTWMNRFYNNRVMDSSAPED